jgi:hypothetical protein
MRQIGLGDPIPKITRAKWTRGVAQKVKYLLCKHKALSSNLSPTKKKKKTWVMRPVPSVSFLAFKRILSSLLWLAIEDIVSFFLFGLKPLMERRLLLMLSHMWEDIYATHFTEEILEISKFYQVQHDYIDLIIPKVQKE